MVDATTIAAALMESTIEVDEDPILEEDPAPEEDLTIEENPEEEELNWELDPEEEELEALELKRQGVDVSLAAPYTNPNRPLICVGGSSNLKNRIIIHYFYSRSMT